MAGRRRTGDPLVARATNLAVRARHDRPRLRPHCQAHQGSRGHVLTRQRVARGASRRPPAGPLLAAKRHLSQPPDTKDKLNHSSGSRVVGAFAIPGTVVSEEGTTVPFSTSMRNAQRSRHGHRRRRAAVEHASDARDLGGRIRHHRAARAKPLPLRIG